MHTRAYKHASKTKTYVYTLQTLLLLHQNSATQLYPQLCTSRVSLALSNFLKLEDQVKKQV